MGSDFVSFGVAIAVVIGLSQWVKQKAKLAGAKAEWAALVIGVTIGGLLQYATKPPVSATDWLAVALVALGMGLVPSGLFQFVMQVADRSSDITPVENKLPVDSGSK